MGGTCHRRGSRGAGALAALTSAALLPLGGLVLLGPSSAPAPPDRPPAVQVVAGEQGASVPLPPASPVPAPARSVLPVVDEGDGAPAVVPGTGARSGPGPLRTVRVEVEGGLGVDPGAFARAVETVLSDPRSWGSSDRLSFQRVDGDADVVVVLASPRTTDRLCAPLRTNGRYSCANGARAVINSMRWLRGADAYAGDLDGYRQYVVNHEVGHVLGQGHVGCPAPGAAAPVMLQQTIGLQGCTRNPWPYP